MRNEKLIRARQDRGWTQAKAAEKIGISLSEYKKWEAGVHYPPATTGGYASDAFKMSVEQLGLRSPQTSLPSLSHTRMAIPTTFFDVGIAALLEAQQCNGWTFEQLMEELQVRWETMQHKITRRETVKLSLSLLAGLPLASLGVASSSSIEEILPHCEASLNTAWKLAKGPDLALAQEIVSSYVPALLPLANKSSDHQEAVASLMSKSYLLDGLISMHLNDLSAREVACRQAVKYAEISGNSDLIAASHRWLACTYYYEGDSAQAMKEYQVAARSLDTVTPLLRSSILVETAVIQARQRDAQGALHSLGRAHETFYVEASEDQNNLYTGHDIGVLTLWSGLTHYDLGNYRQALNALLEIDGLRPKKTISERIRLQFLNTQALAALKLNELEQARTYLEAAGQGAIALGSKLRFAEAQKVFQVMDFLYAQERSVREIRPLFLKQPQF